MTGRAGGRLSAARLDCAVREDREGDAGATQQLAPLPELARPAARDGDFPATGSEEVAPEAFGVMGGAEGGDEDKVARTAGTGKDLAGRTLVFARTAPVRVRMTPSEEGVGPGFAGRRAPSRRVFVRMISEVERAVESRIRNRDDGKGVWLGLPRLSPWAVGQGISERVESAIL